MRLKGMQILVVQALIVVMISYARSDTDESRAVNFHNMESGHAGANIGGLSSLLAAATV